MAASSTSRIVHGVAVLLAASILVLICSGGLVTSHEAGMAVPDWPNSFGYKMFLFPVSRWVGDVLFEHTHRLIASGVGLLTIFLVVVASIFEGRLWVRLLCWLALAAVIIQGVLGGLRVTEHNPVLGLFHGCLAQAYLCLVVVIAFVTSRAWNSLPQVQDRSAVSKLRTLTYVVTGAVFFQLVLGAAMRHSHAGLAIHDFPTVYGKWFPAFDSKAITEINSARAVAAPPERPTSLGLIHLQYLHRGWAIVVLIGIVAVTWSIRRRESLPASIRLFAVAWPALVMTQIVLGAWTVLSNKAADVATSHVFVGALTLVVGVLLSASFSTMLSRSINPGRGRSLDLKSVASV
jgi:heme a synthase